MHPTSGPRGLEALLMEKRGTSYVQILILIAALALGSVFAVRKLGARMGGKLDCTGTAIQTLSPGAGRCLERLQEEPVTQLPAFASPASLVSPSGASPVSLAIAPVASPAPQPTPAGPGPTPAVTATPAPALSPTPSPQPGPTPTPPAQPQFTPENEAEVQRLIAEALARHDGDVALAFADLRDQRQRPENFFDSNLAIAADYLRARLEVRRNGPVVAADEVEAYLLLKRTVGVPQEGPGPVSPFSELQAKYMRQGVADEARAMGFAERVFFASPVGVAFGAARFLFDSVRGDE
jgi:hypothetical protein